MKRINVHNFLISTPAEPKVVQSLEQEFSISATLYGAQLVADSDTFFKKFGNLPYLHPPSQPDDAVYPLGILKIINLSYAQ